MLITVERKLFKIGEGGFAMTLPKAWINYHHLKPGDKVVVVADYDLTVSVISAKLDVPPASKL